MKNIILILVIVLLSSYHLKAQFYMGEWEGTAYPKFVEKGEVKHGLDGTKPVRFTAKFDEYGNYSLIPKSQILIRRINQSGKLPQGKYKEKYRRGGNATLTIQYTEQTSRESIEVNLIRVSNNEMEVNFQDKEGLQVKVSLKKI